MNNSRHLEASSKCRASTRALRRGGFTLTEILVVLVIAALLSGLVLSGFSSLTANNRRTTCQTNMNQIYSALRLYAADANGAFPYYGGKTSALEDDNNTPNVNDERGIGLWALYTFPLRDYDVPANNDADKISYAKDDNNSRNALPTEIYLRKAGVFRCPSDPDDDSEELFLPESGGITEYNPRFLSYQVEDEDNGEQTYKTTRVNGIPANDEDKRQLLTYDDPADARFLARTPPSDTVVFWCPWHRNEGRGRDIVLFYDGSVQSIDKVQDFNGSNLEDWRRKPEAQ